MEVIGKVTEEPVLVCFRLQGEVVQKVSNQSGLVAMVTNTHIQLVTDQD